jgi:transposase-like protein
MKGARFDERFPAENDCLMYLEQIRWGNTQKCTYCGSTRRTLMIQERRYHCNTCNTSFSVTVGTLFHQTHLSLQKWFQAIILLLNARRGVSVRQLAQYVDVNKDTAWRMAMKIQEAMAERDQRELLFRIAEMHEAHPEGMKGRR